ncbi:MAG TPA: TauD/TfdA family dioxygenase [Acidobacteriota bacterium]|nr:TauD/TfdA family dioxygenase [Acidobacteriota bacterium]
MMKSEQTAATENRPGQEPSADWDEAVLGRVEPLQGKGGPVVVRPSAPLADAVAWAEQSRSHINGLVEQYKAVLFRDFAIDTVEKFQGFLGVLASDLLEYTERSTPRSTVEAKIYTSTEYPQSHEIPMHNENSYSNKWPRRILFCCIDPADEGGATPIADSRMVFEEIPEDIRRRFVEKQVMYSRNFGQGVDLSWQEAFQTDDKQQVESYCRSSSIEFEWFDGGNCLHTRQVRPAAITYLPGGERLWFNQAHLFHVSSLEAGLRESLSALFPAERLPRHAFYGDGSEIDEEELEAIRQVYRRTRLPVDWRKGDLLLLDNLFYAHGRMPFQGSRRVIVAMDGDGRPDTSPLQKL